MFTLPSGLRSVAASSAARPTASNWKGTMASGRQRFEKYTRRKQVLRYRLSKPKLDQADAELQPAAATAQPVVHTEQQLEVPLSDTDLTYELQQSQERLRIAKALGLDKAVSQHLLATDWPPSADTAGRTLVDTEPEASSDAISDSDNDDSSDGIITFRFATATSATEPVQEQQHQQQQSLVVEVPQATSENVALESSVEHAAIAEVVSNTAASSSKSVLGWGLVADALVQVEPSLQEPLTSAVQDAAVAVESTEVTSNNSQQQSALCEYTSDQDTLPAVSEEASALQRVIPREQLKVVQVYWAQAPNGKQPRYFYMPDPLASPCKLEVSKSLELELPYDEELVDQMWQEVQAVAEADRGLHVTEPEELAEETCVISSSESSFAGDVKSEGQATTTSEASASEPAQEATPATAMVGFSFHCQTKPGERLWLVGDHPGLGAWDLQKAVKLKWREGHVWQAAVELPLGSKAAYKAVLQLANQQYKWQSGTDFKLEVTGNMQTPQQEFK